MRRQINAHKKQFSAIIDVCYKVGDHDQGRSHMLNVCYYPTTTILIDDNKDFLSYVKYGLPYRPLRHAFSNPKDAIKFIHQQPNENFITRCVNPVDNKDIDHLTIDFDLRRIHHQVLNIKRFSEISVVIVDYSMPGLDGYETCEQLKDRKIKKIMLTGEADHHTAVELFNNELIDKFILKTGAEINLKEQILEAVQALHEKYFASLTQDILNNVSNKDLQSLACLNDKGFDAYFNTIRQSNNAVEYYLMDSHGTFMFVNDTGQLSWLVIFNQHTIEEYYDIAFSALEGSSNVLDKLKNKTHVPLFITDKDYETPPHLWEQFLHPAEKIAGEKDTYYVAYIEQGNRDIFPGKPVLSYQDYIKSLQSD